MEVRERETEVRSYMPPKLRKAAYKPPPKHEGRPGFEAELELRRLRDELHHHREELHRLREALR